MTDPIPIDILSRAELKNLTGVCARSKQIDWLVSNRYRFEVNALGYPVVLRSFALGRLGIESTVEGWDLDESNVA